MATINKRSWTTPNGTKGEAWQLSYVDGTGTPRRKNFKKKADAEAYRIKVEGEVVAGVHTADSVSVTIAQAADLFLEGRKARELERSSIDQYNGHIENHLKPLIGATKLSRLTMPDVKAFAETLIKTGRSRSTAVKVLSTLRSIIKDAQGSGLVAQNVALGVTIPVRKRHKEAVVIPTNVQLRAMVETAETAFPDFYPMLLTGIFAGLRSSELRGLRLIDIDLKAATISVRQRADAWAVIGAPKSAAGRRTIPIPPMLVSVLRAWILKAPKSDLGLAFPNSKGGAMLHSNLVNRAFWPLQIAAGVCEPSGKVDDEGAPIMRALFGLHSLRHAAASSWINQRVDLKRLMVWLGHSTIQMTLDTYGHLIVDEAQDAAIAKASEAALFG